MANFYVLGAFLLAFIVGEAAAGDCGVCPEGWAEYNNYCYKLSGERKTYEGAKADCAALGAHMAAPHDAEEIDFLLGIKTYVWVGCDDIASEGNFVCCDGTSNTFTNWRAGEPNDASGEDCATLVATGEYNDINCSWADAEAVCKKHVSIVEASEP